MNELLAQVRLDQRERWVKGERVLAESYLERHPELGADEETALDLIYSEILLRRELGETPRAEEYTARFPHYAPSLRAQLELEELLEVVAPSGQFSMPTVPHEPPETQGDSPGGRPPGPTATLPAIPGYEILGQLGVGGLGVVYKARQLSLDRVVALKMLRHEGAEEADDFTRMQHEARAATRLAHAHLVQVHEFGKHNGRPYYTMEHVGGGSLRERLAAGPLPPEEAACLIEKLARALDAVHRQGIVHRDLKPGNVLLTMAGEPKVADFGLAKYLDAEASLNPSGALVGTPCYMSPEQAAGKSKEVGPATDVWALGAILYECLTGRAAFPWTDLLDTLDRVRHAEPERPTRLRPGLSPELETISLKCLEKEPHRRYAGALELAEDLRRFQARAPIAARPRRWYERPSRWVRRRPLLVAVTALLLLTATAVPFVLEWPGARPSPDRAPPDPEQPRRAAEATLAAGRPFFFKGDEPLPGPFCWVLGGAGPPRPDPAQRCFSVETIGTGLLELVADPRQDRYRFSAWARHDGTGGGPSRVGLYFGYREGHSAEGQRRLGFYSITFTDRVGANAAGRDRDGRPRDYVRLHYSTVVEQPNIRPTPGEGLPLKVKAFQPADPGVLPGPWRRLVVTVTPRRVVASWEKVPGQGEPLFEADSRLLERPARAQPKINPETVVLPTAFHPRQGLGLYVRAGKASFREVQVEPLAVGNGSN